MVRNWRMVLIPVLALAVVAGAFFLYQWKNKPEPKPIKKPDIVQPKQTDTKQNWYIKFSVKDQKATSYTEEANAPVASSGDNYFIGSGAVHPQYPLNAGGKTTQPIIPYGTTVYLDKPIDIQGAKHSTLVINDTGDVYYGLWRSHPYWIDVYYGQTNYYNNKSANKAGVRLIDYHWYEPWR